MNGFFCKTAPVHLFNALGEYFFEKDPETDVMDILDFDTTNLKVRIKLEGKMEELPAWEDEEEEEAVNVEAEIVAQVYGVGQLDESSNTYPSYYLNFRRKGGDAALFANFMADIRSRMEKFTEGSVE